MQVTLIVSQEVSFAITVEADSIEDGVKKAQEISAVRVLAEGEPDKHLRDVWCCCFAFYDASESPGHGVLNDLLVDDVPMEDFDDIDHLLDRESDRLL